MSLVFWLTSFAFAGSPPPPTDLGAAIDSSRSNSIRALEELLRDADPAMRSEMQFRLAELYAESARAARLQEMAVASECDGDCPPADTTRSNRLYDHAVHLYEALLAADPRYARADEARYNLGDALDRMSRPRDAIERFAELVRLSPDSKLVPDALVRIGDDALDHDDASRALLAYQKARKYRDSPLYGYATYKAGWCLYNLGRLDEALTALEEVLDRPGRLELREEAKRDLVLFYTDADQIERGRAIFDRYGFKAEIPKLYDGAAQRLVTQGRHADADALWRGLVAEFPTSPSVPDWTGKRIDALKAANDQDGVLRAIGAAIPALGRDSAWRRANPASNADDVLEPRLRAAARDWNRLARKIKVGPTATATADHAAAAYDLWLRTWPSVPEAPRMRLEAADLAWKAKRVEEAWALYDAAVPGLVGDEQVYAAESRIFAAEAMTNRQPPSADPKAPLTAWEQRLVDACGDFARRFPADDRANKAIYKTGYLLYRKGRVQDAAAQLGLVIARAPRTSEAVYAAHLVLDGLALEERWAELARTARGYAAIPGLGDAAFDAEVGAIAERAAFKDASTEAAASVLADRFEALAPALSDPDLARKAWRNVAVYAHDHALARSIRARRVLVDDPRFGPRSPTYEEDLAALGADLEDTGHFADAAATWDRLGGHAAARAGDRTAAAEALLEASKLHAALGHPAEADADLVRATGWLPKDDPRRPELILRQGDLEVTTRPEAALAAWRSLEGTGVADLALGRRIATLARLGRHAEATALATAHATDPDVLGQMRYYLAERRFAAFGDVTIAGPERGAPARFRERTARLSAIEAECTETVRTGAGEPGTRCLVLVGRAWKALADDVRRSPVPSHLDAAQVDLWHLRIEDLATSMEAKALDYLDSAVAKANELGLGPSLVAEARSVRQQIEPEPPGESVPAGPYLADHRRYPPDLGL